MTELMATAAAPDFAPLPRLSSGLSAGEAVARARAWWDKTGRHVIRNPAFRDPDLGLPSGILRGLPWDELEREEKLKVARAWHGGRAAGESPRPPQESRARIGGRAAGESPRPPQESRARIGGRAAGESPRPPQESRARIGGRAVRAGR